MLEYGKSTSRVSGGIFMSEKYVIVSQPEQVPPYDPKAMAEGLGMMLLGFLGPLLLDLDQWLDKRLIRTLVQAIEAILTFRDRVNGLVLSETLQLPGSDRPGRRHQTAESTTALPEVDGRLHRAFPVETRKSSRSSSGRVKAKRDW